VRQFERRFDEPAERDLFSFDAMEGMLYQFHLQAEATNMDYVMQVLGPPSTSDDHPGNNFEVRYLMAPLTIGDTASWVAPESGTFRIAITAFERIQNRRLYPEPRGDPR